MKIVIAIILIVLVLAAIGLYVWFMLGARDLICCGDIKQEDGVQMSVTRIYTSELNAKETLSEIVTTMNDNTDGAITAEQMTELLATYQNIIYAPVFTYTVAQEDTNTFSITGSVFNGLDEEGEPTTPDFHYRNLSMTVTLPNGHILAAQNIYEEQGDDDEDGEVELEFVERRNVIDPIIVEDGLAAAFAFRDCDSFRVIFKGTEGLPTSVTLSYVYDIVANNPTNFSSLKQAYLQTTIKMEYDELGRLAPTMEVDHQITVPEEGEED